MAITSRVLLLVSGYLLIINFCSILYVNRRYYEENLINNPFLLVTLADYKKELSVWFMPFNTRSFYFIWIIVMFIGIEDNPCHDISISNYLTVSTWFKLIFWMYECLVIIGCRSKLSDKADELYPYHERPDKNSQTNIGILSDFDFDFNF